MQIHVWTDQSQQVQLRPVTVFTGELKVRLNAQSTCKTDLKFSFLKWEVLDEISKNFVGEFENTLQVLL